ncbi:TPA: hypothetical protein ACX6NP_003444 [Photobacterium damselae]
MDINKILEQSMSLEHQIFIKYGLVSHPTEEDIAKWYYRTQANIADGMDPEQASRKAAFDVYDIDPRILRKSQADTIEALLLRAKQLVERESNND